jgi:hypothetical protein
VAVSVRTAIVVAALPWALACASTGGSAGTSGPRPERNLITAEELRGVSASNLYDAIRLLRPQWMSATNPSTFRIEAEGNIVVYMDRIRFGEPEQLRAFPPSLAVSVRFLDPSEANAEFGVGHLKGAIVVVTRRAD